MICYLLKKCLQHQSLNFIKKNYNLLKINKIKDDLINLGADKIDYIENYNLKRKYSM